MLKFLRAVSKQLWKKFKIIFAMKCGTIVWDLWYVIEVDSRKCFLINTLIAFDFVYFYLCRIPSFIFAHISLTHVYVCKYIFVHFTYFINIYFYNIYLYILLKNKINLKMMHLYYACYYITELKLLKWIFMNFFV